jgi:tRNA (guanine-N7-)-methyltransferase
MRAALAGDPELVNAYEDWAPPQVHRPRTRYEQRALAAGRQVFELAFRRR